MARKRKKPKRIPAWRRREPGRRARAAAAPGGGAEDGLIPAAARRWIGLGLDIALALVCLIFLIKSAGVAASGRFFTDECFHTYIVEQVIDWGVSPAVLHELYSGMANNTHPLFHWLAAPFRVIGGRAGLAYVNVALCGIMLGSLYWILRAWVNAWAARIAVSVTLLFSVIHICTQIFYIEILSALTFMLAALAITVALGQTDWKVYFLAGAACALALLSKQTGYILLPVVALSGLWMLVRRRWRHVIGIAVLTAVFIGGFAVGMWALAQRPLERFEAIYAPIERRMVPGPFRLFRRHEPVMPDSTQAASTYDPSGELQASGGGISPGDEPGGARRKPYDFDAKAMLQKTFGGTPRQILGEWWAVLGVLGAVLTALCLVHVFLARRQGSIAGFGVTAPLLLALLLLVVGAVKIGTVDRRHFISWVPTLAACTGIALTDLVGRVRVSRRVSGRELVMGASTVLLLLAFIAVLFTPNYRIAQPPDPAKKDHLTLLERLRQRQWNRWRGLGVDAPAELVAAARAIGELGTDNRQVLSVWTSSTWFYSGHPTTWAGVNVPRLNTLLLDPDAERAYMRYYTEDIGYVLIDNSRIRPDEAYNGVLYPETGINHIGRMLQSGVARLIYPEQARQRPPSYTSIAIDRGRLRQEIHRLRAVSGPRPEETRP